MDQMDEEPSPSRRRKTMNTGVSEGSHISRERRPRKVFAECLLRGDVSAMAAGPGMCYNAQTKLKVSALIRNPDGSSGVAP